MPVHNSDIADCFTELADLLEIAGANPFRIRAYRNAAREIASLPEQAADLLRKGNDLSQLPGIGKDLAKKIEEIVRTKKCSLLEETRKTLDHGLVELLRIEGLGPKRVRLLHDKLKISSLQELARSIKEGKLTSLRGFGERSINKIESALGRLQKSPTRFRLPQAEEAADALLSFLTNSKLADRLDVAGSYRRQKETVGDLDFVGSSKNPKELINYFCSYEDIERVISKGSTRASARLRTGMQVDFRVVPDRSYGAALYYFTGSKAHNIAVRRIAQRSGLKINEYGVFRGKKQIAGATEEDLFRALGLRYIEPELREERGEIEAAKQGRLPVLISLKDIRGDLHAHTDETDGRNSLREMVDAAKALGYQYVAITDHSKRMAMANGLTEKRLLKQIREIDKLNSTIKGITVLKGIEVDILEDGRLDLPDSVLAELDVVVCSVHYKFNLSREKQTERFLRAMENPYCKILGHLTGRLIGSREPYELDVERILREAAQRKCVIELNAQPNRLDLPDYYCKHAKELGIKFSIATDAHATIDFRRIKYGVGQARRGWLGPKDVINSRSLGELKKLLTR